MRFLLLLLLLFPCLPAWAGTSARAATPARTTRPAFKGFELYSWIDPASQRFRFLLMLGTNRNKTSTEILASPDVIYSIDELKARLALLAPSETVGWANTIPVGHARPPQEDIDQIIAAAASVNVNVYLLP
jgi:hypothetical protein